MRKPGRLVSTSAWTAACPCVVTLLLVCLCVLATSGCASSSPLPQGAAQGDSQGDSQGDATRVGHDAADGWRLGVIVRFVDALPDALAGAPPDAATTAEDCRMALSPSARATGLFAEFAYRQGRRSRLRIVLLDRAGTWAVGDAAYIDVRDCRQVAGRTE